MEILTQRTLCIALFSTLSASADLIMSSTVVINDPIAGLYNNSISSPLNGTAPFVLSANVYGNSNTILVYTNQGAPVLAVIKDSSEVFGAIDSKAQLHGLAVAEAEADGPANSSPSYNTAASNVLEILWSDTVYIQQCSTIRQPRAPLPDQSDNEFCECWRWYFWV